MEFSWIDLRIISWELFGDINKNNFKERDSLLEVFSLKYHHHN